VRKILSLALAAVALSFGPARADDPAPTAPKYDWGVAYFMSYDNNLEGCGQPIIEMIRQGVASEKTVAAVQADFTDGDGMHRYTITSKNMVEEKVDSEDSADEDRAIEYLEWFVKTFPCKKYVVTFLNHGGAIDAMCYDEKPGKKGQDWMSGRVLGAKMRAFKEKLGGKWELFFLQQCGRGSMENLYSFRGTADFIMSSPVPVGAPNTYYTALHKWLAENPNATGDAVAEKIATEDQDYTIYTCLRTKALDDLPKKLDAALAPFISKDKVTPAGKLQVIHPVGEPIHDARVWFDRLSSQNAGAGKDAIDAFFTWTTKDLFTLVKVRARPRPGAAPLCGLSIFAPRNAAEAARYGKLDLYGASKLPKLWTKMGFGAAAGGSEKKGEAGKKSSELFGRP
jgi:hypothetical protein